MFLLCVTSFAYAQQSEVQSNLQEAIQARYRITQIGPSVFGMKGGEDSIRKLGGTILVMKKGLYGTFDRREIASNAITDGKRSLLAGKEEVELVPGERFYANSVRVGQDFVTVGLLSVDPRSMPGRVGRVWAAVNFFFKSDVVQKGDLKSINSAMDEWLLPADSLPNLPSTAPTRSVAASPSLQRSVELKPGMVKEDVVAGLGEPAQTITFANRTWLTYPTLVAVLEDGKLTAVDRSTETTGKLSLQSEDGAEIYVDGELAGTAPTTLNVPVGSHKLEIKRDGKSLWQQDVRVFPGADVVLKPRVTEGK